MVNAVVHVICGNCGNGDKRLMSVVAKNDKDDPSFAAIVCKNCSTIHPLDSDSFPDQDDSEIARLRAELEAARVDAERLQVEMTNIICSIPEGYYMDPPDGGYVTVAEQVRRMALDAERYRYIRRKVCIIERGGFMGTECDRYSVFELINMPKPTHIAPDSAIELDAAIDAGRGVK